MLNIIPKTVSCGTQGTLNLDNTPQELKENPYWCRWQSEPDIDPTKKPHKIPYSAVTGQKARVNDPATLTTYHKVATALAAVEAGGIIGGMNYAFGYCDHIGIDLDKIRDPETEEITCDKAAEIIHRFLDSGACVEISPSDTGIRIICKGALPRFGKGVKGFNHFEVYGKGEGGLHFLSITGKVIQRAEEIPVCQDALDWMYNLYFKRPEVTQERHSGGWNESQLLSDDEIIEKVRRSKRGSDFALLFDSGSTGDPSADDLKLCAMLAFYIQDAAQIDRIFRRSKLYRDKWERADYRTKTINKALEGLTTTWQPCQHEEGQTYGLTESEAARRFKDSDSAERFMVLRQTRHPQVQMYKESDGIWQADNHHFELKKAVREISKVILSEMVEELDPGRRDKLFTLAKKLETRRGLEDITSLSLMELSEFLPDNSNAKDHCLCAANGVLSLLNGVLLPHWEGYQFTLQSPVVYNPDAQCPLWVKFIDEFCCGDVELVRFLQSWLGYCCSGYVTEQKMAVFFGFGQNGKSVLLEVMKHILGGFAAVTPADTLLQRKSEQSNDLAALEYKRFVLAVESDEGRALAEALIKLLTGGDGITCRKLFEEYRTFKPRFKLNLATNSKPRVNGTDFGIWRRLLLIPCKAEIINPDKHLPEKLKREAPGILNWLVEGFQNWRREGLIIPACVSSATAEYRAECDTVGRFLTDKCNPFIGETKSSTVYKAYSEWCITEGHKPYSQVRFSQKMAEKGFPSKKMAAGMFYPDSLKYACQ